MKKFQIKPRHIVLALSLLAMLIAFMVYTVCVSGKYSYTENVGAKHLEADQVHAKSSDETVAKIVSVENYTEEGNNELKVTVEGVNPGDCVVTLAYRSPENGQMLVRTSAFRVLPIGVVYDLTIDSFTSLKAVIPLGVAAMLLIVAVLSLSFREKQRNGEFYYSMVIIGGVILFLLLNVIVTLTDSQLWSRFGEAVTTKDILALIVSSGNRFVMFSEKYVRQAFFSKDEQKRKKGRDIMWYIWCAPGSPLFGKNKMTTFEHYMVADKDTYEEEKNSYYDYLENPKMVNKIFKEFGLNPENSHIINGHVPVHQKEGEDPVKCNGKVIVIDGGFSKPYQKVTGIAGYTLIYNSYGMTLASHEPFVSREQAIIMEEDIVSKRRTVYQSKERLLVKDTDAGKEMAVRIADIKQLLEAYRNGLLIEKDNI